MSTRLRHTALVLASLPPDERQWLLSQLPSDRAATLTGLINEATRLGVAADAALLASLIDGLEQGAGQPEAVSRLLGASAEAVARALGGASSALVARLLNAQAWAWEAAYLKRLAPAVAREVDLARQAIASLPARELESAVIESVAAALPVGSVPVTREARKVSRFQQFRKFFPLIGAAR